MTGSTATAPSQVFLFEPNPGTTLGEQTQVARELSTSLPDSQLQYQVGYSPDGGESWVPVAVDVPGTERSVSFDSTSTRLAPKAAAATASFACSNAVQSTIDEAAGLSTSAARS